MEKLEDAIGAADIRIEAREILRTLIDRIEVTPQGDDEDAQVRIVLYGELASIFALAEEDENVENNTRFSLVAGARNHRELTLSVEI